MQPALTPKQTKLFDYLKAYLKRHGRAPSLRRAAADLGVSHSAVAQGIQTLETKGVIRREGRYGRRLFLLVPEIGEQRALASQRRIPIVGRIAAGLPLYAQTEWDGHLLVDGSLYTSQHLFALRVQGDSMRGAGILEGDLAICEARQFANDGEIVVALVHGESATVKRFFLKKDHIELRPQNPSFASKRYDFDEILIQAKVVGLYRGPEQF